MKHQWDPQWCNNAVRGFVVLFLPPTKQSHPSKSMLIVGWDGGDVFWQGETHTYGIMWCFSLICMVSMHNCEEGSSRNWWSRTTINNSMAFRIMSDICQYNDVWTKGQTQTQPRTHFSPHGQFSDENATVHATTTVQKQQSGSFLFPCFFLIFIFSPRLLFNFTGLHLE